MCIRDSSTGYFRCTKRTENKGCPGCGKIRKEEFEQFIFSAMQEKFKDFQILHGREEKVNPKLTAYQAVSYTHLDVYKRQVRALKRPCKP